MLRLKAFVGIATMLGLLAGTASAEVFDVDRSGNTDLVVVHDAGADLAVRLYAFSRAQKSIEAMSHTQTSGPTGMEIILGMRAAMNRGIAVSYLYERVASLAVGDFSETANRLLADSALKQPIDLVVARPIQKFASPFGFTDLFHQKFVIIDRDTPNEMIIIGGRNHDEYLRNADTSYVLRRVDGAKASAIMDDLKKHYDECRKLAESYYTREPIKPLGAALEKKLVDYVNASGQIPYPPSAQQILATLEKTPAQGDALAEHQFRPESFQLVTNDALEEIIRKKNGTSEKTPGKIEDDLTNFLVSAFEEADRIELNAYILLMAEPITEALKEATALGKGIVLYTNGADAYGAGLGLTTFGAIGASYNHEAYVTLKGDSPNAPEIYMFSSGLAMRGEFPMDYNHRKLALLRIPRFDGTYKYASWLLSYNFTESSALKNDELGVSVVDERLHNYLSKRNTDDGRAYHIQMTEREARESLEKHRALRYICRPLFRSVF